MDPNQPLRTKIIIIGAGFGGLEMAVALEKDGHDDFLILEKASGVGGVWRDNRYPGCTCDVPSHLYSFSFAPYRGHDKRYLSQKEILGYLQAVAAEENIDNNIRFNTEVLAATYRQDESCWDILTTAGDYRADIIITAIGQLHRPNIPDIPGRDTFEGDIMHSAQWKDGVDLRGKRVSIIGTGSSAAQMLPEIAKEASTVTVYQRTPQWILPKPDPCFSRTERLLLHLPGAHHLYRRALSHGADLILSPIPRCRAWRSVVECYARRNLRRQIPDRKLRGKLLPSYPIGSKRILFDNNFYSALKLDNVELVTEPIIDIGKSSINTQGGLDKKDRQTDIIILATGFRTSDFLLSMDVRGLDNHTLAKDWRQGPEAFFGLAVHRYPNMFMIAGPNSFNPAGSNPEMKEIQVACIMRLLKIKEESQSTIEAKQGEVLKYYSWLGKQINKTVWSGPEDSWYKYDKDKVTNPWPLSLRAFRRRLSHLEQCFEYQEGPKL